MCAMFGCWNSEMPPAFSIFLKNILLGHEFNAQIWEHFYAAFFTENFEKNTHEIFSERLKDPVFDQFEKMH